MKMSPLTFHSSTESLKATSTRLQQIGICMTYLRRRYKKKDTSPKQKTSLRSEYALSIHAAAPRIEAHYQFYNTTIEPILKSRLDLDCETWLHFNGQQYCDADLSSSSGHSVDQECVIEPSSPICHYADILQTHIRSSLRSHHG
jgi:hypothetical protein